jgi:drug/metabolite transporter (DMT)-like permease
MSTAPVPVPVPLPPVIPSAGSASAASASAGSASAGSAQSRTSGAKLPAAPAPTAVLMSALSGATGMVCVGGSVAVSAVLAAAPLLTAQAVRYAAACLLLLLFARLAGRRVVAPRGTEWLWLLGVTVTGLLLFNIALVAGSSHAEPAVLGVAVACVPLILAVIGPVLEGRRPSPVVLLAALVVTAGAALVQGVGRSDAVGLAWALVVLGTEAGFTLLAVPVLGRLGPWGVSVHTTWLAAVVFAIGGVVREGPSAVTRLTGDQVLAVGYLAVAVTAVAFVLWYYSVGQLGAARAGLLTGVAPVAAAASGVALGGPAPQPLVWVGIAVVAAGLALGSGRSRRSAQPDAG